MGASVTTKALAEVFLRARELKARDLYRRREYTIPSNAESGDGLVPGSLIELSLDETGQTLDGVELVAPAGSTLAELHQLIAHYGISPYYPSDAIAEAERFLDEPGFDDDSLTNLEHLPFITIDNEDSRDLDQALYIERLENRAEGYRVYYALADASYYVRPGSALFREALRRGTSFYLPGFDVPMLPRALSEGIVSLNPQVQRRAVVFRMEIDGHGRRVETVVLRSIIKSRAKLTYLGVQEFHDHLRDHDTDHTHWMDGKDYTESLLLLKEVGELRIADARARDVVSFDRAEVEITLDGPELHASVRERNDVERWNEQVSLLCNMEGARLLAEAVDSPHVQPVFRVHPSPTAESRSSLERAIRVIVRAHELEEVDAEKKRVNDSPWIWRSLVVHGDSGESLADYLQQLPENAATKRVRLAIVRIAMHMSQAALFTVEHGPHHGVGADGYSRISAPMREVVGIFTHKELLERLGDPREACDNDADEALRLEVVEAGNRSRSIQRELAKRADKLVIDQLLRRDLEVEIGLRPWRAGTVVRVRPTRLYVELDSPPIEVKVYCRHLTSLRVDDLELDSHEVTLRDTKSDALFALGDEIHLRVRDHDRERRRWVFDVQSR